MVVVAVVVAEVAVDSYRSVYLQYWYRSTRLAKYTAGGGGGGGSGGGVIGLIQVHVSPVPTQVNKTG